MKQFVLEVKDLWKRTVIHSDKEIMADEMKFKFLDSIFYYKNFLVNHVIILF